ncbi:MAG: FKBP-type peptidyl-prolyl cis-trans isomerase [Bacteroidia bacterium]
MKKYFFFMLCGLGFVLPACNQSASETQQTPPPPPPVETPASAEKSSADDANKPSHGKHQPYVITDSSKIIKLDGGVKMFVVKEGTGPSPSVTSTVSANYEGRLLNGNIFDSSYERKSAADFNLGQVIKGWQVGIPKMKMGSSAVFIIPAAMGYGEQGQGAKIPPNATLVFDVDLITFY